MVSRSIYFIPYTNERRRLPPCERAWRAEPRSEELRLVLRAGGIRYKVQKRQELRLVLRAAKSVGREGHRPFRDKPVASML